MYKRQVATVAADLADILRSSISGGEFVTLGEELTMLDRYVEKMCIRDRPTSGRITIGDRVVFDSEKGINIPANKRKVGFLFQNYALWPNMTVYKNIAFGLTNIKDELPRIDFEAKKAAQLIEVLKRPDETVRIIKECIDKKGKLDTNKAHIKLIDRFEISMFSAKTVMGWKLHESLEPGTVASARLAECEKTLESARAKCAAEGCVFNDDFAYVKDGKVLTSVRKLTAEEIDLTVRRVARIVKIGMFMDRDVYKRQSPHC